MLNLQSQSELQTAVSATKNYDCLPTLPTDTAALHSPDYGLITEAPRSLPVVVTAVAINENTMDDHASQQNGGMVPAEQQGAHQPFVLDRAEPLDPASFPNQPGAKHSQIPASITNMMHLLAGYGVVVRYNVIKKKLTITCPGYEGCPDNTDSVVVTHIYCLANINGMSTAMLPSLLMAVGDRNQFNPVADWITSKPWDGVCRLEAFYETLQERNGFPKDLKHTLMYRWALSAVAAALMSRGFRSRGVLTLQGPQSMGKTAWGASLIPDEILRADVIKLDHHLEPGNKDSLISAICHWICEIGELEGTLRKDMARLKGFITDGHDKVRVPYAQVASEYPRRTVFYATVNDSNFLADATGNTRWWTIPVTRVNYKHGIDMQQLFAQLAVDFGKDVQWWLTAEEEQSLELQNREHRAVSALHERILDAVDLTSEPSGVVPAITAIELLRHLGNDRATNPQCKECGAILRELLGEPKRINGRDKWRVPLLKRMSSAVAPSFDEDDRY